MKERLNFLLAKIRTAGYKYAAECYESWSKDYAEELEDEESYYYDSVDEDCNPKRQNLEEQISEQASHCYYCDGPECFFSFFDIDIIPESEDEEVIKELYEIDLYEYFWEGVDDFAKKTYK